jgi:mannose-6-phosphate isomerase-like protein (cupin superfamily)
MSERYTIEKALQLVAESADDAYGVLLSHGTLEIGYYMPDTVDPQQPHTQDEVYIVQSGSGYFVLGDDRQPFERGEALFVPAGVVHRFEDFSDDFAAWVVFYGPQGGEDAV